MIIFGMLIKYPVFFHPLHRILVEEINPGFIHSEDMHRIINYFCEILICWDLYFNSVPFTYPVDIFERLWVVDRLDRLGISRYFTSEIQDCLDYTYR
jgi:hypothetical protein